MHRGQSGIFAGRGLIGQRAIEGKEGSHREQADQYQGRAYRDHGPNHAIPDIAKGAHQLIQRHGCAEQQDGQ